MSSEKLGHNNNVLKGDLGGGFDILTGSTGEQTDLGIARRFGGAAAAYSLRDIGAMNGSVVRVRRSSDSTEAIDDEERFSANQVQDGTLENWVNGKLESTLPADVDTAAAAYSLRKIKSDYSGDVVRIRRSSDDVEVDVAFDSEGKVSASSPITDGGTELTPDPDADLGSTTATDLNGFLNETLTVGTAENGTGAYDNYDFEANGNTGFDADNSAGGVGSAGFPYSFASGDVMTVTYTVTNFSSTSGLSPQIRGTNGTGSVTSVASGGTIFTANGTYTDTLTGTADGTHLMFADGNTGSYTISNFEVLSHTHQAFVHTWYDQAGSNDAVQETAANQPKIAESGALLDGIKFDADVSGSSPKYLETTSKLGDSTDFFIATVIGEAQGQDAFGGIITSRSAADEGFAFGLNASEKPQAFIYSSGGNTNAIADEVIGTRKRLLSLDKDSTAINGNVNAVGAFTFTSNTMGSITEDKSFIGVGGRTDSTPTTLGLRANINELVFYNSDQAANRFKIESNINNYYGLYNDANDLTQTEWQATGAESFSSTSTDGFSFANSSGTAFIGVTLSETLTLNDSVFVSFNASGVDIPDESPQIRLRDSVSGGDASSSLIGVVNNGFNSFELEYDLSQFSSGDNIVFSEGNTGGGTVTISDFKVSRIARNGFVETWYDQSGNGEDMTQGTAGSQPSIVRNGGQVKDYNGNNSIDFVSGSTRVLDKSGTTTAKTCIVVLDEDSSGSSERAILGFSDSTSFMRLDTTTDLEVKAGGGTANYRAISADTTSLYFWYTNGTDEDKLFENNVEISDTLSYTPPNLPFTRIGARNSDADPYNSRITEVIAFAEDLSSDRTVLQDNVNNNYNIF